MTCPHAPSGCNYPESECAGNCVWAKPLTAESTPGPWKVCGSDSLMFGAARGNGSMPIGFIYGPSFAEQSTVGQRAIADCRLAAAAPELLDACKKALYALKGREHDQFLRDAISKATGKPV